MLLIAAVAAVLTSTVSCRYQPEVSAVYEEPKTWSDLFYIFWNQMNTGYAFWDLDDPSGTGWDEAYDTYMPRFDKLGDIGADTYETDIAFRYFFELTDDLTDGHFGLFVNDGNDKSIRLDPSLNRLLSNLGYTQGQIYKFIKSYDGNGYSLQTDSEFTAYNNYTKERLNYFFTETLGKSISAEAPFSNVGTDTPIIDTEYFSKLYYTFTNTGSESSDLNVLLGYTDDDIVYFGFSSFGFTPWLEDEAVRETGQLLESMVNMFHETIKQKDTKGIIIDLRGNAGGYTADLDRLWGAFTNGEDIFYEQERIKNGDNRYDFGGWMDTYLAADSSSSFDKSIPIVILINYETHSCAEATCLFFRALRDYYGYDVTFIGEQTWGSFGVVVDDAIDKYKAGRTEINSYIPLLFAASGQARYRDGSSYEGIGFPPDFVVGFNYDDFSNGRDDKLDTALSYLRTR